MPETERSKMELEYLRKQQLHYDKIVADSAEMQQVLETSLQVADKAAAVLIQGEIGVGKETIAKIVHRLSSRKNGPFIRVNCKGEQESLLDFKLFGNNEESFAGTKTGEHLSLCEIANGGTLFLDEVGALSLNLQAKLLTIMQKNETVQEGGTPDIRIICSTNRNLKDLVLHGCFREDLYYQLCTLPIYVPALRHRKKDIIPLAKYFLEKYNQKYDLNKEIDAEVFSRFMEYHWPGNVRELESIIERLVVCVASPVIRLQDLNEFGESGTGHGRPGEETAEIIPLRQALENAEKRLLVSALRKYKNMGKAAEALQVDRTTVLRKISKYNIQYPFKEH